MTPRLRKCCRCGVLPRRVDVDGTVAYLCVACLKDPAAQREREAAVQADPEHPRLFLIQHGWVGGWSRVA